MRTADRIDPGVHSVYSAGSGQNFRNIFPRKCRTQKRSGACNSGEVRFKLVIIAGSTEVLVKKINYIKTGWYINELKMIDKNFIVLLCLYLLNIEAKLADRMI